MTRRTRDFIDSIGGFRKVAGRLGKPDTTVHGWTVADRFPAYLFHALCELADEAGAARPGPEMFRFLPVPATPEVRAAA
jgi:hypothetical protein